MVPIRLKYRWTIAARFAFLLAPMAERIAVIQVPIFCPMIIGSAALNGTIPVRHRAWRIPTDAEDDWMIAVSTAPATTPRIGLENFTSIPVNSGTSARGSTAPLMAFIPYIRIANPTKIAPTSFFFWLFVNMIRTTPISARIGENDVGLKSWIIKLSLWIPVRLKIHEVTVVPILAPMMIPTTWDSFMIPEFTKPTTITVVAEDDWITAVTPIPRRTALMGLEVSVSRIRSSFPPATFASPSPIKFIP